MEELKLVIQETLEMKDFDLIIYGSAANGLSVRGGASDVDLSLIIDMECEENDLETN